jgi:flagellar biosynthesis protein FlhG
MSTVESRRCDAPVSRCRPTLWAVGGGKGGVGKSVVASSLAISFARRGYRCALVDLDLGAANLHSILGASPPRWTLSDFLDRDVKDLSEILVPTPFANLSLAGGPRASLDMANPKYSQKEKLLRHVRGLAFDHVFLDLSAGCAFNTLDFFLAAERKIVVLVPERTSIENAQNFLKAGFFRSLREVVRQEPLRSAIGTVLGDRRSRAPSARDLVQRVAEIDPHAGKLLAERAAAFAPMLVINQLDSASQRRSSFEIASACRHYLASGVRERGALPRDERVRDSVAQGKHVLELFPGARFSVALEVVAEDLLSDTSPGSSPGAPPEPARQTRSAASLPPLDLSRPGDYLRRCRETLGLSLPDVGRRTRIRCLARIEGECFDELPPESYVSAFVQQYARSLGVREAELLAKQYVERYRATLSRK